MLADQQQKIQIKEISQEKDKEKFIFYFQKNALTARLSHDTLIN